MLLEEPRFRVSLNKYEIVSHSKPPEDGMNAYLEVEGRDLREMTLNTVIQNQNTVPKATQKTVQKQRQLDPNQYLCPSL